MPQRSIGFSLGNRHFGQGDDIYIIAEIGSNHGGDFERAKRLILACVQAGVNAVKFQVWTPDKLHHTLDIAEDGSFTPSKVISVLDKYQIPKDWLRPLFEYCASLSIDFLATPFDLESARLLKNTGVFAMKIASGDLTYDQLLCEVSNYELPVFVSTGMATLDEIEYALSVLKPNEKRQVILLHCVGAYPPDYCDANLMAIRTMQDAFGLPIGFSDHYPGHELALGAIALGACVLEKHITFSRDDGYPDSAFSLEINELESMVKSIRMMQSALGDGLKTCRESELSGLVGGRRGIFAAKDIQAGHRLTADDIAIIRPNISELQPKDLNSLIGKQAACAINRGIPLKWEYFKI